MLQMKSTAVWFTSDTHFGHTNLITKFKFRPFTNTEEMDEAMINNWNSVVKPGDYVYHLGDFSFYDVKKTERVIQRLQGQIHFIPGNHDKVMKRLARARNNLIFHPPLHEIKVEKQRIVLCHYALRVWHGSHRGTWQLYGHSHNSLPPIGKQLDVGVDCWEFTPVSYDTVKSEMAKLESAYPDYHQPGLQEGHVN